MLATLKENVVRLSRQNGLAPIAGMVRRVYRWGPLALKDLTLLKHDRQWRDQLSRTRSTDEWVTFVREAFDGSIRPQQRPAEIIALLELLKKRRPQRMLEIGTAEGGTLFLLCRVLDPNGLIVSVDLPGGWFGGGYPPWRKRLYRRFASDGQQVKLIRADSHDPRTFETVKRLIGDERFDFILIDGDHTYRGAKQDFEMYQRLVADDGLIAFHDIVPEPRDRECQVHRLWNELKSGREFVEFVENWTQDYAGIGVLLRTGGSVNKESNREC